MGVSERAATVHFVDASTSDPELLTVKAHRLLQEADVIIADDSVSAHVLSLARRDARLVVVGQPADESRAPQWDMIRVMVESAREHRKVVRLLGSTPHPFGRPADEADALSASGIEAAFVPGVSALGASTDAGGHSPHRIHRPAIVFLTGLSGSGKSTLASALQRRLLHRGVLAAVVDGDVLRTGLSNNLGFSADDRRENIRRASELALHLADVGAVVIVALISPFQADRAAAAHRARAKEIPFAEVFINAPLAVCERRDPKNLYKRARAGEISSFTGIDSPYEPPAAPALELHTDLETVEQSLEKLTTLAFSLARPPAHRPG